MVRDELFYVGYAGDEGVAGTAWFVGQFVPAQFGLRHQTDVELKWGVHKNGERRAQPGATGTSTTITVLIEGAMRLQFGSGSDERVVMLEKRGDYVIFSPQAVHLWQAVGDCIVLSIRFPSIEQMGNR